MLYLGKGKSIMDFVEGFTILIGEEELYVIAKRNSKYLNA